MRARRFAPAMLLAAACGTSPPADDPRALPPNPAPPLAAPNASGEESEPATLQEAALPPGDPADMEEELAADEPKPKAIGHVAGVPLSAEDLLYEWHQSAGRDVWLTVDKLVAVRLAFSEAQRLGLRLSPEMVEARVKEERTELSDRVAGLGLGLSVDDYIRTELGVEPKLYYERMRRATVRQLIVERTVRAWTLSNENASLRLIVVRDTETLQEVQETLARGTDFAEVARLFSVDETAEDGGFIPFLVRQEHAPLARLAFSTEVGEIGGPLPTADHQFLIRVEERRAPLQGSWGVIAETVEASLAEHAVRDAEYVHWNLVMQERYPIDLDPLKELLEADR